MLWNENAKALLNISTEQERVIERFLIYEAALLDERQFTEWLDCFADDLRYWAPTRDTRPPRERSQEFAGPHSLAHFDESKGDLQKRVLKIESGRAWAEEPPSRTRRLITNIRCLQEESDSDRVLAICNFLVLQARADREQYQFFGTRLDALSLKNHKEVKILSREIRFDHTLIHAPSMSIFF